MGAEIRKATRVTAISFGVLAGIGGLEHGYIKFQLENAVLIPVLVLGLVVISVISACGHDRRIIQR